MAPRPLPNTGNDAPAMQLFGSHEHRMQVSRATKERLVGKNTKCENRTTAETAKGKARQEKWEAPARRLVFDTPPAATVGCSNPEERKPSNSLLSPVQLKPCQAPLPQPSSCRDGTHNARASIPLLSPPPSFQPFQSRYSTNNTWSTPPQTQQPLPQTPFHPSVSSKQPRHTTLHQYPPRLQTPLKNNAHETFHQDIGDWISPPEHPHGAEINEIMHLLEGEMALYEMREMYEEAACRRLQARYNARICRQRREVLRIKLGMEERRKREGAS